MKSFIVCSIFFGTFCAHRAFSSSYLQSEPIPCNTEVGEPLFLTPYIDAGKIQEGQDAARVRLFGTNITSYSGYLTVNKTFNSNLFLWFFPSEKDPQNASVLLWLQGGPGSPSMSGIFTENGPFYIDINGTLKKRQYYWSQQFNVIYIDNPIGTGFSFTEDGAGYATDQVRIGKDLYCALIQFFKLFPYLQKNDFFLSGESYAGKYLPALGFTIHTHNKIENQTINLKGLAIASGFSDPENMMNFADHVYQIGLVDSKTKETMRTRQDSLVNHIRRKDYLNAAVDYYFLLYTLYRQAGEQFNVYNYLNPSTKQNSLWNDYIQTSDFRSSVHVGNRSFYDGSKVSDILENDFMQSVRPWVEVLMDNYRVMFYNGQLDVIVAYPLSINFFKKLNWSGAEIYKSAPRKSWIVENELAGFTKSAKGFTEVLVRNAGHYIPMDQPKWTMDLINRFVNNIPF
ncbi:unnamed protein product [Nezara viridula]|uniref:Carboxypeptidase n=1 Tax=Nezara viridula TaxID=85310 RepID=A0A9P0H2N3_NEZVI|nr:unnamed protein product [Nezara viridula]